MWVAVHALSGLALGTVSPLHPALTVAAALVLHALLDLVPHWDYTRDRRRLVWAAADVAVACVSVAVITLWLGLPVIAVVAAVASALPDLDVFDAVLPGGPRRRLFPSHWVSYPHGKASPEVGIPVQAVVAIGSLAITVLVA